MRKKDHGVGICEVRWYWRLAENLWNHEFAKIQRNFGPDTVPSYAFGRKFSAGQLSCSILTKTLTFSNEICVDVIENWPSQSPHLNLIENLFAYVKKRVFKANPESLEELWSVVLEEFQKIPNDFV